MSEIPVTDKAFAAATDELYPQPFHHERSQAWMVIQAFLTAEGVEVEHSECGGPEYRLVSRWTPQEPSE